MAASRSPDSLPKLVKRLRDFSTCDVGDALVRLGDKRGGLLYGITRRSPATATSWRICGPAVTVRMCSSGGSPGVKLRPFVDYNKAGKIMIIETPIGKCSYVSSCWGAIESARAKALGAAGVIVSGNVRQVSQLQEFGLPVMSRGIAALGTRDHMRLGKVNEKITVGGISVNADDILLADDDGVIVVRPQQLSEVIESCEYGEKYNKAILQAINKGASMKVAFEEAGNIEAPPRAEFPRRHRQ